MGLLKELGGHIGEELGEPKSTKYLLQRLASGGFAGAFIVPSFWNQLRIAVFIITDTVTSRNWGTSSWEHLRQVCTYPSNAAQRPFGLHKGLWSETWENLKGLCPLVWNLESPSSTPCDRSVSQFLLITVVLNCISVLASMGMSPWLYPSCLVLIF